MGPLDPWHARCATGPISTINLKQNNNPFELRDPILQSEQECDRAEWPLHLGITFGCLMLLLLIHTHVHKIIMIGCMGRFTYHDICIVTIPTDIEFC